MPEFKIGDRIIHSVYGAGEIVAIDDRGLPQQQQWYYSIETDELTLWVPVEEDRTSLHLPISLADHPQLLALLRSKGEKMTNNRYKRADLLANRLHNASPKELCLIVRDLSFRAQSRGLNSNDVRVLKHAKTLLQQEGM